MSFQDTFKLKENPFRITPAISSEEIVWAGFPNVKSKFEKRIKRAIKLPNSSLVLNWGEYGSGKTHSARYFNKESVLDELKGEQAKPYSMVFPLPKGKEPVQSIYISIVDKINIGKIRGEFEDSDLDINQFIKSIGDNIQIQNILKAIFNSNIDENDLKKYLYGNISNTELKKLAQFGILRKISGDGDYTKFISGFFSCLTAGKKVYSCVIIWIDEFEDISVLSSSNVDKTNNFLREVMDNTPNNLLVFINLTQTALIGFDDLGEYLSNSVRSRIKEVNNFGLPTIETLEVYLKELLSAFRVKDTTTEYYPFEDSVIDYLLPKLENSSLRAFNDAFSLLLELADMDGKCPISLEYFKENESEIIWDKV